MIVEVETPTGEKANRWNLDQALRHSRIDSAIAGAPGQHTGKSSPNWAAARIDRSGLDNAIK